MPEIFSENGVRRFLKPPGFVSVVARVMSGMVVTAAPVPNTSQFRWPWPLPQQAASAVMPPPAGRRSFA
ncbi:hypothetical protein ABZS88_31480 [Streptomyces sp. NPDC005480]|uniref:hypothetical protein n=1 Tax=Streptomyces sp. NPDC005480 TaxID=3154880 RepID=UPI0033B32EB1